MRQLLVVVEYEHRSGGQPDEQLPQETPTETVGIVEVVRREQRQRISLVTERLCRLAQVIEKSRGIAVTGVDLIPQARRARRFEIGGRKRRLAGPRWSFNPDDRMRAQMVDHPEQPVARHRRVETRSR
ncbi:MAG: hypothetical protein ABI724_06520 [Betaproteobacteria bacterium]